jgi:glycerol uptake facilitator-like aquaporin
MFSAKIIGEFLGTFVFLMSVQRVGQAIPIAVTLLAVIYLFGGNFNPAISAMKWYAGELSSSDAVSFIAVQLLAGWSALKVNSMLNRA